MGKAPVQFAGQAKEVYQRLGELPNQLPERLRWQLRELKVRKSATPAAGDPCMPLVTEVLASPAAKKLNEKEKKQLLQFVLIVLLQEQHEECAVQFAMEPQNGVSPDELAIWLCHSYVAVPQTKESAPVRKQAIDKLLAAQGKNAECAFRRSAIACSWPPNTNEPPTLTSRSSSLSPKNAWCATISPWLSLNCRKSAKPGKCSRWL